MRGWGSYSYCHCALRWYLHHHWFYYPSENYPATTGMITTNNNLRLYSYFLNYFEIKTHCITTLTRLSRPLGFIWSHQIDIKRSNMLQFHISWTESPKSKAERQEDDEFRRIPRLENSTVIKLLFWYLHKYDLPVLDPQNVVLKHPCWWVNV